MKFNQKVLCCGLTVFFFELGGFHFPRKTVVEVDVMMNQQTVILIPRKKYQNNL